MPKRRSGRKLKLKPVLHIFCEGEKTEPNYLNKYLDKYHPFNRRLNVIKIERTKKTTARQLVDVAEELKARRDTPESDDFWVVYDREGVHKYSNDLHSQSFERAKRENINIAFSNVCFEVWLLLHLVYSTASYTDCDNFLANSPFRAELAKRKIASYSKSDAGLFDVLDAGLTDARMWAPRMNKATADASGEDVTKPYLLNPYTDVHLLLDAIDEFVNK